jgi:hypothetical protein
MGFVTKPTRSMISQLEKILGPKEHLAKSVDFFDNMTWKEASNNIVDRGLINLLYCAA